MRKSRLISALLLIAFVAPTPTFAETLTSTKAAIDPARYEMELDFKRLKIPTGTEDGVIDSMALRAICGPQYQSDISECDLETQGSHRVLYLESFNTWK